MPDRGDWLLLAIGNTVIEPIQLQKLMFLFAQESTVPTDEKYDFVPYNWGPCSFEIYDDLEAFFNAGLIERYHIAGKRWCRYALTTDGRSHLRKRLLRLSRPNRLKMYNRRRWVKNQSFEDLLHAVYRQYPEYATRSVFAESG